MSVAYDNVSQQGLDAFRHLSADKGMSLLRELDKSLSKHDRETNPDATGDGRFRAGLGLYLIEENMEDTDASEN